MLSVLLVRLWMHAECALFANELSSEWRPCAFTMHLHGNTQDIAKFRNLCFDPILLFVLAGAHHNTSATHNNHFDFGRCVLVSPMETALRKRFDHSLE